MRAWALVLVVLAAGALPLAAQDARVDQAYAAMDVDDFDRAEALARAALNEATTPDDALAAEAALATLAYLTEPAESAVAALQALDTRIAETFDFTDPRRFEPLMLLSDLHAETGDTAAATPVEVRRLVLSVVHQDLALQAEALRRLIDLSMASGDAQAAALFASDLYVVTTSLPDAPPTAPGAALVLRAEAHFAAEQLAIASAVAEAAGVRALDGEMFRRLGTLKQALEASGDGTAAALDFDPDSPAQTRLVGDFNDALSRQDWDAAARAVSTLRARTLPGDSVIAYLCQDLGQSLMQVDPDRALPWAKCIGSYPATVLAGRGDPSALLFESAEAHFLTYNRPSDVPMLDRALEVATLLYGPTADWTQRLRFYRVEVLLYDQRIDEARAQIGFALANATRMRQETLFDFQRLEAAVLRIEGDLVGAERAFQRAARTLRMAGLADSPRWTLLLEAGAELQSEIGNHDAAATLWSRALEQQIARHGEDSSEVLTTRLGYGGALAQGGRVQEAFDVLQATQDPMRRLRGTDPGMLLAWGATYGSVLRDLGREEEARAVLRDVAAGIDADPALMADAPQALLYLTVLGKDAYDTGDFDRADAFADQALAILPEGATGRVDMLGLKAQVALAEGRDEEALTHLRRIAALLRRPGRDRLANAQATLPLYIEAALRRAAQTQGRANLSFIDEALGVAQELSALTAGSAIARASARWDREPELAALVRDLQDVEAQAEALAASYGAALAAGRDGQEIATRLQAANARHAELTAEVATGFPDYARYASPAPVPLARIAELLGPDEALVLYATSDAGAGENQFGSTVFAITREQVMTGTTLPRATLRDMAERLRCQAALPDPRCAGIAGDTRGAISFEALDEPETPEGPLFDLDLAFQAHEALLAPVAAALEGKRRLIVVPDPALVALPFHTLVTERPPEGTNLREAQWLLREKSVFVVPTVASLVALRSQQDASTDATQGFLGIGDPLIGVQRDGPLPFACELEETQVAEAQLPADQPLMRGGLGDPASLRRLSALPDTRCELRAAADFFGADSRLLLHGEATETAIRALDASGALARYQTISFATHGLIAGEVGAHDAGIVLTPPDQATAEDDGLLSTGDIAQLTLNARMVLLSACNTGAGGGGSDEGLSGLASAFFYAGARSLLVSHWPVYSDAATRLTTDMLARQRADPALGYAEALRMAMLAVLDDPASDSRALHPAYWAPFMVVGEGG